jgi:hypothetical protein
MDLATILNAWAPVAGEGVQVSFAVGANAAVQLRAAQAAGGFAITQNATPIAVKVMGTTGYAHIAIGSAAVAQPTASDPPVTISDGWVRMMLHPTDTHIRVLGVTAVGTLNVWFQEL